MTARESSPARRRRRKRPVDGLGLRGSFEDRVRAGSMRALPAGTLAVHGSSGLLAVTDGAVADALAEAKNKGCTATFAAPLSERYKS